MPCYLLHFDRPLGNPNNPRGQARHYLGSTERPINQRIEEHLSGRGAKITAAAIKQGIKLNCVRVWAEGSRELEIWLKEAHNNALYCPVCNPSVELKVRRFLMLKQIQEVVQEVGAIEAIALLCDVLEENPENQSLCDQLREILFYSTREAA
jgi:hypothetical protein